MAAQEFVQSQASFFDSYAQAGTLWAPSSDAFCYSALPQGGPLALHCLFGGVLATFQQAPVFSVVGCHTPTLQQTPVVSEVVRCSSSCMLVCTSRQVLVNAGLCSPEVF